MNDCFYCENGEKLKSLMIEICKLPCSTVYFNRDQKHPGRCIVMFKDQLQWGLPFSDDVPKKFLSDEEYEQQVAALREEIHKLCGEA